MADIIIRDWCRHWLLFPNLTCLDVGVARNVNLAQKLVIYNNIIFRIYFSDAVIYIISYEVTI